MCQANGPVFTRHEFDPSQSLTVICESRWPSIDLVLKLTVSAYYVRVLLCFKGGQAEDVKHLFGRTNRCMVSARLLLDRNVRLLGYRAETSLHSRRTLDVVMAYKWQ